MDKINSMRIQKSPDFLSSSRDISIFLTFYIGFFQYFNILRIYWSLKATVYNLWKRFFKIQFDPFLCSEKDTQTLRLKTHRKIRYM